mgnify:CR=1 FL=1
MTSPGFGKIKVGAVFLLTSLSKVGVNYGLTHSLAKQL